MFTILPARAYSRPSIDATLALQSGSGEGWLDGIRIALNVQNLFDKDPPLVLNGANIWDNATASLTGRYFAVDLSKSW